MRLIIIFFLISTGCSTLNPKKIISPSESLYYEGNTFLENKNYSKAIESYKKFLDKSPTSPLSTSAKLNLCMAYYYEENFKEAYQIIKNLNVDNENLKNFLQKIMKSCEEKLGEKIVPKETEGGKINIEVKDTYMDEFGSIIVKGKVDKESTVYVDGEKARLQENNEFVAKLFGKKGKPITIVATDKEGNQGKLEYFPESEAPKEPTGLRTINVTSNSVQLEWNPNTEKDLKGYKLYYQLKGDSLQEIPKIIKNTLYEIVGLQNLTRQTNKTFQFYLRAVDKMDNYSNPSDIFEVTLP